MEDFAQLGIDVDSTPLRRGRDALDKFGRSSRDAARDANTMQKSTAALGRAVGGMAAGFLSLAAAQSSITQARAFQASMAETSTLIKGTKAEMMLLEKETKRLASTYGGTATEQVKAFYQAISAGADGVASAAALIDQANKLAIGGVTDITTATDGLTTALNVYKAEGLTAAEASDAMFVAMKAGKALDLDTPIPTPDGFVPLKNIQDGDLIFDENGEVQTVIHAHQVIEDAESYEVEFSDGSKILACRDHNWLTYTDDDRRAINNQRRNSRYKPKSDRKSSATSKPNPLVRTTRELMNDFEPSNPKTFKFRHYVQKAEPVQYPRRNLPVDPYVLGAWLGDGARSAARISTADPEMIASFECAGYRVEKIAGDNYDYGIRCKNGVRLDDGSLVRQLKNLGVLNNKHVPEMYLVASVEQRLELLRGLMDTDGYIDSEGKGCEFVSVDYPLASAVKEIVSSLGMTARIAEKEPRQAGHKIAYRVTFTPDRFNPFRLKRKASLVKPKYRESKFLGIVAIRPVASRAMRCLTVSGENALFLCGRSYIVTHNTTIGELSGSIGAILPIAQSAGISFDEVTGSIAALTKGGLSTSVATTSLRGALAQIVKPSKQAADAAAKYGVELSLAQLQQKGFAGLMAEITEKTGGSKQALTEMFPAIEAMPAVLGMAGAAGESLNEILADMEDKAGATEEAFNKVASGAEERLSTALGALGVYALSAGDALLTALVPAVEGLVQVMDFASQNADLLGVALAAIAGTQIPALLVGLGTAVTAITAVTTAAKGMAVAMWAATGPWGILAGLVAGAAAYLLIFRDNSAEADTAATDLKDAQDALNTAVAGFAGAYAPQAGATAIDLANDYYSLAAAAYEAAAAEVAKNRAIAEAEAAISEAAADPEAALILGEKSAQSTIALMNSVKELKRLELELTAAMNRRKATAQTVMQSDRQMTKYQKDLNNEIKVTVEGLEGTSAAGGAAADVLGDVGDAAKKAGEDFSGPLQSGIQTVAGAWGDFVVGGFNDFEGLMDSVVNSFKRGLSQMIATAAQNQITLALGIGVTGAASLAGGSGASTGGGGLGILGGLLGSGSGGLLGGITNSIASIGGALGGLASGLGGVLSGGGLVSSFANLGGLVTGASAGLGAIGAAIPAIGAIVALGSIIADKGFSKEYESTTTYGSFSEDLGLHSYVKDFYKGGWFKGDDAYYTDLDDEIEAAMGAQFQEVTTGIREFVDQMGLSADGVDSFTQAYWGMATTGMNAEQVVEALQAQLLIASEEFAELALGTSEFSRQGESALETINRLSTALTVTDDALDMLGHTLYEVSLAGADMASELVEAFGGADAMGAAVLAYWQAFYSEAEQQEKVMSRLADTFAEMGIAMPESRDGFRQLVDSLDLSTTGGRELYAELIGLASAMDQVLPQVAAFTLSMTGLLAEIDGEIGSQLSIAQDMASDSRTASALWYKTATTLRDFLRDLTNTDLTAASPGQQFQVNQSRFWKAFEAVQAGDASAAGDLPGLSGNYLESLKATSGSALEYRRAASQVQAALNFAAGVADLEGANEDVLTTLYEQQISVLTALSNFLQLESLTDDQLASLDTSIQALVGDWDATLTEFEDALGSLEGAIKDAEAFSYDHLVENLEIAIDATTNANLPEYLKEMVKNAGSGILVNLDFVVRSALSAPDKWLAVNSLSEHVKLVQFVADNAGFSDEAWDLATQASDVTVETIKFIAKNLLGRDLTNLAVSEASTLIKTIEFFALAMPADVSAVVFNEIEDLNKVINFYVGDDIPDETQRLALDEATRFVRTIDVVAGHLPGEVVRELALLMPEDFKRHLNILAGALPNGEVRDLALSAATDFDRFINISQGSMVTQQIAALALATSSELRRNIKFFVTQNLDAETRTIALAGNSEFSRTLNVLMDESASDPDAVMIALGNIGNYAVAIEASFGRSISADVRRVVINQSGGYAAIINATFANMTSSAARRVLLTQQGSYTTNISAILGQNIDAPLRLLLLNANTEAVRAITIAAAFADTLTDEERVLLESQGDTVLRTIEGLVNPNGIGALGWLFLQQLSETGDVVRVLKARVWPDSIVGLGLTILGELAEGAGTVRRDITSRVLPGNIGPTGADLLSVLSGDYTKAATTTARIAPGFMSTTAQDLFKILNGPDSVFRTIEAGVAGAEPYGVGALLFAQLNAGDGSIERTILSKVNQLAMTPTANNLFSLLNGGDGSVYQTILSNVAATSMTADGRDLFNQLVLGAGNISRNILSKIGVQSMSSTGWKLLGLLTGSGPITRNTLSTPYLTDMAGRWDLYKILTTDGPYSRNITSDILLGDLSTDGEKLYELLSGASGNLIRNIQSRVIAYGFNPTGWQLLAQLNAGGGTVNRFIRTDVNPYQMNDVGWKLYNQLIKGDGTVNRFIRADVNPYQIDGDGWTLLEQLASGDGDVFKGILTSVEALGLTDQGADILDLLASSVSKITKTIVGKMDLSHLTDRQKSLLDMITGTVAGAVTLGGTFSFTPEQAFSTWYSDVTRDNIATPMGELGGMLAELRDAVDADRAQREQQVLIANLQTQGATAEASRLSSIAAATQLIADIEALESQYEVQIVNGNLDATLKQKDNGKIAYKADALAYDPSSLTADIAAFKEMFALLEPLIPTLNEDIGTSSSTVNSLRKQVEALGGVPAFARGGMHSGGLRLVGENGPEIEATGPARYYSAAQTQSMMAGGDAEALLRELVDEVAALRSEQAQLGIKSYKANKKTSSTLSKWDAIGQPATQT